MNDLRRIEIRCHTDENDGHTEICLGGTTWQHADDPDINARDIWVANIDVAGIIARVAAFAAPWAAESAARHGCARVLGSARDLFDHPTMEGCRVSASRAILRPGEDLGDSPDAYVYVPNGELDGWLDLIRFWLEAIAKDANELAAFDPLEHHDDPATTNTTTTHDSLPEDGYPPRVDQGEATAPDPWTPGGDCEHLARGLDRAPVTRSLRCQTCRRHENAQATARALRVVS